MIDEKTLVEIIARSTQDECRQMGELFLSFATAPRDVHWDSQMRRTLSAFPHPPKSDMTLAIEAGRRRVQANEDALWAEGWHPIQMRQALEGLGYTGLQSAEAPSAQ